MLYLGLEPLAIQHYKVIIVPSVVAVDKQLSEVVAVAVELARNQVRSRGILAPYSDNQG